MTTKVLRSVDDAQADFAELTAAEVVGGGLPPQWTDGGNGDVTAQTDDPSKGPLTLIAPDSAPNGAYALRIEPAGINYTGAILVVTGDPDLLTGQSYILRAVNELTGRQVLDFDAWGSMAIAADPAGGGGLGVYAGDDSQVIGAAAGVGLADSRMNVNVTLRVGATLNPNAGFILTRQNAALADGDLDAKEVQLWFDDTDGAASPRWKGKSADGTVVSGSLGGGSITPATDPGDIADPTLATPESNALKLNALMGAMRTAGMLA